MNSVLIEIAWGECALHPPGHIGGQHVGTGDLWYRRSAGPWRKVLGYRSQHKLLTDIEELLELDTGV